MSELKDLVKKAQAGDSKAFGDIYELLVDRVYRFIYLRTSNERSSSTSREDAEDLTEQVFIKCWESLKNYQEKGIVFEAFIFRIARNQVIDYYRTKKKHFNIDEALEVRDERLTPEEQTEKNLDKEFILKALNSLTESYKEIIILKFIEEKNNKEISQIIGKPVDQIRVLQSRALKALRKIILKNEK